jgi:hypothetical protein
MPMVISVGVDLSAISLSVIDLTNFCSMINDRS